MGWKRIHVWETLFLEHCEDRGRVSCTSAVAVGRTTYHFLTLNCIPRGYLIYLIMSLHSLSYSEWLLGGIDARKRERTSPWPKYWQVAGATGLPDTGQCKNVLPCFTPNIHCTYNGSHLPGWPSPTLSLVKRMVSLSSHSFAPVPFG